MGRAICFAFLDLHSWKTPGIWLMCWPPAKSHTNCKNRAAQIDFTSSPLKMSVHGGLVTCRAKVSRYSRPVLKPGPWWHISVAMQNSANESFPILLGPPPEKNAEWKDIFVPSPPVSSKSVKHKLDEKSFNVDYIKVGFGTQLRGRFVRCGQMFNWKQVRVSFINSVCRNMLTWRYEERAV